MPAQYPLAVWWKGDDDLEFFTLRCRREDQMRQWEATINRLIKESAQRRASERGTSGMSRIAANSTNPAPQARQMLQAFGPPQSVYSNGMPLNSRNMRSTPYDSDEQVSTSSMVGSSYGSGPQGYPPHDGFEFEPDEDDFEDYPPTNNYAASGRGTPMGNRRNNALSMPPERDAVPGYDRPRAQTEHTNGPVMAQWRNNGMPPPMPSNLTTRPGAPRMDSVMSNGSYASDASFGNGVPPRTRPPLRSQFSSTKLKTNFDGQDHRNGSTAKVPSAPSSVIGVPTSNRSRSASQPTAYVPKSVPPPLPTTSQWNRERSNTSMGNKRGSGSSQSTGDSSDYSPNSSSPITPFGSSESSLGGVGIRTSRSQNFENAVHGNGHHFPPVKVKVHFNEDIFVIQVPRATEYNDLVEKVGRKIRLCGPRRDDGPLRVKYRDEDGDMVSLGSTEDVQMAFEQYRPGGQVTLFVT